MIENIHDIETSITFFIYDLAYKGRLRVREACVGSACKLLTERYL